MSTISRKHLSQPWFDFVFDGTKSHEGRINDGFWKTLQVGDKLVFWNNDTTLQEFTAEVVEREEFLSFEMAINKVGLSHVLPSCSAREMSIEDSVKEVYYQYFSPKLEEQFGVVMFKFNILH